MTAGAEDCVQVASSGAVSLTPRQFVVLIVTGTALLQALWIAVVPPFRGSDEFDHAYRAAAVAGGQWRAGQAPEDGRGLLVAVPGSLVAAAHEQCASLDYTGPDNCSPAEDLGDGEVLVASGAANYNPLFYWVVGTAAAPFDGAGALYAMRFAGALLCLVFIGLAAWALTLRPRRSWAELGIVTAMTPVMLFSTGIAAPNGLEMAAALALWSSLLGLDGRAGTRGDRGLLVVAIVAASVLSVLRLLGPAFVVAILVTVWALHPSLVPRVARTQRGLFVLGATVVTACAGGASAWVLATGSMAPGPELQGREWSPSMLILWPLQAIAAFPYRDMPGATIVYPVVLLAFTAMVGTALRLGARRERWVLGVTLVAAVAIPLVITALTHSGRGAMWQGRYGLPYAMGAVLVAAWVLDRRVASDRWRGGLAVVGSVLMAVATASCFIKVLRNELTRPASVHDAAWHAPSALVVIAGTAVAWALLLMAVRRPRHAPA